MKVLLYLTHSRPSDVTWAEMLAQSMGEDTEMTLLTPHSSLHTPHSSLLIHVAGCGRGCAALLRRARKAGIPTLLSPLGDLLPWQKAARQSILSLPSAIHAASRIEQETTGGRLICRADRTRTITAEEMGAQMRAYYQEIIDASAATIIRRPDMAPTLDTLHALLQASLDTPHSSLLPPPSSLLTLTGERTEEEWRCLRLYAEAQGVAEHVQAALDKRSLAGQPTRERAPEEVAEQAAALYRLGRTHKARLADYAALFLTLRHADTDEQRVRQLLKRSIGERAMQRLMSDMERITGLTEGFKV